MTDLFDYYSANPVQVVDQNVWTDKDPVVAMMFQTGPTIYTPLVDWTSRSAETGAQYSQFTELLEGDADVDPIGFTDQYIEDPLGVDSRSHMITTARYGDKIQLNESSNIFQQWKFSGGRDWRPILQGVLGSNVIRKFELLARNAFMKGSKNFWTYPGDATDFSDLDADHKFGLEIVNAWNLRLGNTGTPVIPGTAASVKVAIVPPGAIFDFMESLAGASTNEAQMWRDASIYAGTALRYEIGMYKNVRFVEVPNDKYGMNLAVLYNAGNIEVQAAVTSAINLGDGAPDPEVSADNVDDVWMVGQKAVTHYVQLKSDTDMSKFSKYDVVSIHTRQTAAYGVTGGVDFMSGRTVQRRIVKIDAANHRLSFDRPFMRPYKTTFDATLAGGAETGIYAIVTKAAHIGFVLVLGSRGGVLGNVNRPMKFYEPKPVDDFESVYRYVWDIIAGYNVVEPNLWECHFCAVSLPKPGGIIRPKTATSSGSGS